MPSDTRGAPTRGQKKKRSRQRILTASARLFRERGLHGTSVNELMGGAGLTRGGFYAHFRDKEDLVAAALHDMFDEAERNLLLDGSLEGDDWHRRATGRYVSTAHVADPGNGCLVPTLSAELARGPESRRLLASARLSKIFDAMQQKLAASNPSATRADAVALLATYVGAIALARAVAADEPQQHEGGSHLADEIVRSVRQKLRQERR
jgi:TetR/AcrR family transcriptional regulator, transcriptional repressor for nem operon